MKVILFTPRLPVLLYGLPVLLMLSICPNRSEAREIYLQPTFNVSSFFDDNRRLLSDRNTAGADKEVFGVSISGASKLGVRSQLYEMALDSKFVINRFSGDFDLDSEDVYLNFTSGFNATQRNKLGIDAKFVMDTSHTSELDVTGLVQDNVDREEWSVTPNWVFTLSNTQFIQASYSRTEVDYDESTINRFFDFTTDVISASFIQQWTPRLQNSISTNVMFFEVPELKRETTEFSVYLGMEYQISQTWSTSVTVGGRFTNTEQTVSVPNFTTLSFQDVTTSDDNQGLVFSFRTDKQFESGTLGASYSRSTSAQGNGRLVVYDRFSINASHKVTHNFQLLLNGGINVTTETDNIDNVDDRTYYYIKPSIRWLLDRKANITAGYQYRTQNIDNNESVDSNSIFINFNYQWDKFSTQKY